MTDSTPQPDDFLHLELAEQDEDMIDHQDMKTKLEVPPETIQDNVEETEADKATIANASSASHPDVESNTHNTEGPAILLEETLSRHNHNDEHVFLDFVHDHIAPGSVGIDGDHEPHTDTQLSITLDSQDPPLEGIDIQRPFVDLLGNHSISLGALEWTASAPQEAYGSLMDMELHKPSLPLSATTQSTSSVPSTVSQTPSSPSLLPHQPHPTCEPTPELGSTSPNTLNNAPADYVSPEQIFQSNNIYSSSKLVTGEPDVKTGSPNLSEDSSKPIHSSVLKPLSSEEAQVPIVVRRSNRARHLSSLAMQSNEYLMNTQGSLGSITSGTPAGGSSQPPTPTPVERMTRSKKVYCYCQKPDDGNVMIQCDNCRQWFHGACVDITEEIAEMMELKNEKFFCEPCEEKVQAWKKTGSVGNGKSLAYSNSRDCNLPTCLNEARPTSDYCSEECAIKGIELQATEAVMNKENIPPPIYIPSPKRVSITSATTTPTAPSPSQPELPKVEQDPIRRTALKGLTECLMIGLEIKSAASESKGESEGAATEKEQATVNEESVGRLAATIEKELYNSTATPGYVACGKDYKPKYRSLFFNLKDKNNVSLRARLLSGELEPYDLVRMSHEELANPELQNINKEMRKKNIHDSVLTKEDEPYIKKTHKGELSFVPRLSSSEGSSIVPRLDHSRTDDDNNSISSGGDGDEHHSSNRRIDNTRNPHKNTSGADSNKNGDNTNGHTSNEDHISDSLMEETQGDKHADDATASSPTGTPTGDVLDKLLARIQTNKRPSEGATGDSLASDKRQRRISLIDNRRETVEYSEDSYMPREPSPYSPSPSPSGSPIVRSTTPLDSPPPFYLEEIQRMTQKDHKGQGEHHKRLTVWHGNLSMHQVAKFSAKAIQIGGPDLFGNHGSGSRRPAWSEILTHDISVDGRIGISAVEAYVSQQAQSATKEIIVLKFEVQDSSADHHRSEFDKLFEYFYGKQRNGVVPQRNRYVKDMYLVPLAAKDPLPRYLQGRFDDGPSVRGVVPKNCLLGVLIINKETSQSHSSQHQARRVQPPPVSHTKATSSPDRRRQSSPVTSRPYPDIRGQQHSKRPSEPVGSSSPGYAQRPAETIQSSKATTYSAEQPSPASGTSQPVSSTGYQSPSGVFSQPLASLPGQHSTPNAPAGAGLPKKIPTLQELQGLVNQLFPTTGSASNAPTGSPNVSSKPAPGPGPTAAAAAVSAQLAGANMSTLMANLPANLAMNQLRQSQPPPPPPPPPHQFQPPAPAVPGMPFAAPPRPPMFPPRPPGFPPGMPIPHPPLPPNFPPLPPHLMGMYGMPMAPPLPPASGPPSSIPPNPPLPPYFPRFYPSAEHSPTSGAPASHPYAVPSPSLNAQNQGPTSRQ
ncbi:hypothetical protein FBU30_003253 [Linnemannia zychae]|nr:hypothetical protein FBU30_003253 [Linnemannia zychae]